MSLVYLDTVGLIALWDESDQWHIAAEAVMNRLVAEKYRFFSSEYVMLECGNAAARRPYRDSVLRLRKTLFERNHLICADEVEILTAWTAYSNRNAGGAGIVDQLSFALMRRIGVVEAFTNDSHFAAAGFVTLF